MARCNKEDAQGTPKREETPKDTKKDDTAPLKVDIQDWRKVLKPALDQWAAFIDRYASCVYSPPEFWTFVSSSVTCVFYEKKGLMELVQPILKVLNGLKSLIKDVRDEDSPSGLLNGVSASVGSVARDVMAFRTGALLDLWARGQENKGEILSAVNSAKDKFSVLVDAFLHGWETAWLVKFIASKQNRRLLAVNSCECPVAELKRCCYKDSFLVADAVRCYDFSGVEGQVRKMTGEEEEQAELKCPRIVQRQNEGWQWRPCPVSRDANYGLIASDMHSFTAKEVDTLQITQKNLKRCHEQMEAEKPNVEKDICFQANPANAWKENIHLFSGKTWVTGYFPLQLHHHECGTLDHNPPTTMTCCYEDRNKKAAPEVCWDYTVKTDIPFRTKACPPIRWLDGANKEVGCPILVETETMDADPVRWEPEKEQAQLKWPGANKGACDTENGIWKNQAKDAAADFLHYTICCCYRFAGKHECHKFLARFHPTCPSLGINGANLDGCRVEYGGVPGSTRTCNPALAPLWPGTKGPEAGRIALCPKKKLGLVTCCYAKRSYQYTNCFGYDKECPAVYWKEKKHNGKVEEFPCPADLAMDLAMKAGKAGNRVFKGAEDDPSLTRDFKDRDKEFDKEWCGPGSTEPEANTARRQCCRYTRKEVLEGWFANEEKEVEYVYSFPHSKLEADDKCPPVIFKTLTTSKSWYWVYQTNYPCPVTPSKHDINDIVEGTKCDNSGYAPHFTTFVENWCHEQTDPDGAKQKQAKDKCHEMTNALKALQSRAIKKNGTYDKDDQKHAQNNHLSRAQQTFGAKRKGLASGSIIERMQSGVEKVVTNMSSAVRPVKAAASQVVQNLRTKIQRAAQYGHKKTAKVAGGSEPVRPVKAAVSQVVQNLRTKIQRAAQYGHKKTAKVAGGSEPAAATKPCLLKNISNHISNGTQKLVKKIKDSIFKKWVPSPDVLGISNPPGHLTTP